jgi:hypothetical protein
MDTSTIDPYELPNSSNIIFGESSFFKDRGVNAELPRPAEVQRKAANLMNPPQSWGHKPCAVLFFSMKLLVKYGSSLSTAEGQCLWAVRKSLDPQVPVPEVYGWCRDGKAVFICMQLIEGQTLEDSGDVLAPIDQAQIDH